MEIQICMMPRPCENYGVRVIQAVPRLSIVAIPPGHMACRNLLVQPASLSRTGRGFHPAR